MWFYVFISFVGLLIELIAAWIGSVALGVVGLPFIVVSFIAYFFVKDD
jgi:hypothetical protein